jgi:two-component system chemotaxis response regulator CheB
MAASAYRAIVMGASAGGMQALKTILPALPAAFPYPIAIVQHMGDQPESFLANYFSGIAALTVKEAEDKEPFRAGTVYLAPGGYHVLVEQDKTLSLSVDARENYCCPAIDVLFESASEVFGATLIGVVLTGGNSDGSRGLKTIKNRGGVAIVQNPATAEAPAMPKAALDAVNADYIIEPEQLVPLLLRLSSAFEGEKYGTGTGG